MHCRDDSVETVGESVQLQSVVGKVTATTRPYAGSALHVPHPRERQNYVSMSVCIEPN